MARRILCILLAVFATVPRVYGQESKEDVVYLKNGSIIRGQVIELIPDTSVKIETKDGSIWVLKIADVERITKEPIKGMSYQPQESQALESKKAPSEPPVAPQPKQAPRVTQTPATYKSRSDIMIFGNIHSNGFLTGGLGYAFGVSPIISVGLEASYGTLSISAYDYWTGYSISARVHYIVGGITVIAGNNMGYRFHDAVRFGFGARLLPMYMVASASDPYVGVSMSAFTAVPYVLAVLEFPFLSLEANLALIESTFAPGVRVGLRF